MKANSPLYVPTGFNHNVLLREFQEGFTCAGAPVGVVAGVRSRPVAPQAGVALAVRARWVASRAAELRRAVVGADGTLAWEEPTSNCRGKTST